MRAGNVCWGLRSVVQINPSVLGGVVVDFGDKTIDLSVASRVNKLNNLLSRMSPRLFGLLASADGAVRIGMSGVL